MRKTIIFMPLLVATRLLAIEQFVYATNGVVLCAPRALPSVGINRETSQPVLGLHGATDAERAACGWYRVIPFGGVIASNQAVDTVAYVVDQARGVAEQVVTLKARRILPRDQPLTVRLNKILDTLPMEDDGAKVMAVLRALGEVEDERARKLDESNESKK